jgi:2-dehydro-3-deoxy-D-gluconate 5-dehydrogenase
MTSGPFDLRGKVAIVTGGNGGIGLGMARGLADAGADIAVVGRNEAKSNAAVADLTKAFSSEVEAGSRQENASNQESRAPFRFNRNGKGSSRGIRAISVVTDVTDKVAVAAMVERVSGELGRIDILVNNAGINIRKTPHALEPEEWESVIKTNLTSAFLCSQAVYPAMKQAGGGKIINIGSMMSIFGASFAPAYAASKGGIVQFTRSCAVAWAADNIQVNALLPGWIDTDLTKRAREQIDGLHDKVLARTPAARWGAIADFAGIAVFLSSNASGFVTGTAIPVDGGFSIMG